MATGVGLRIAEDECTAAVVTDAGELQYIVRESILHMTDDGDTVLGGDAPENSHSITGFVAAVGDPAGLPVDEGEAYRAEDLFATAVFCLINLTTEYLAGPAEFYATYPGALAAPEVQSLREALDYLGLRSVVLVSESDLPAIDTAQPGRSFAYDAARAALTAVLATPAGATPPDPATSENATVQTDVIPTIPGAAGRPQAYSQAMPAAAAITEPVADPPPALPEKVGVTAAPAANPRRIPLLIVAAVLFGLALGGFGVALLFRGGDTPDPPPVRDARSDQSTPALPPPPLITTTAEPSAAATRTVESEPETTPPPPPTTTPEPTTTPPPPTTTPPTSTPRPSATRTLFPTPPAWMPGDSGWTAPTFTVQIPPNR